MWSSVIPLLSEWKEAHNRVQLSQSFSLLCCSPGSACCELPLLLLWQLEVLRALHQAWGYSCCHGWRHRVPCGHPHGLAGGHRGTGSFALPAAASSRVCALHLSVGTAPHCFLHREGRATPRSPYSTSAWHPPLLHPHLSCGWLITWVLTVLTNPAAK